MHGPNGSDFVNTSEFVELAPGELFVIDHISPPEFRLTVSLARDEHSHALVTWRRRFPTAEDCRKVAVVVVRANEENLDRLAAALVTQRSLDNRLRPAVQHGPR